MRGRFGLKSSSINDVILEIGGRDAELILHSAELAEIVNIVPENGSEGAQREPRIIYRLGFKRVR